MILLRLFISFLQIGLTSYGGISMISVITQQMTNNDWMTVSEVSDIVAIAEITPGPLGINCATFAGLRVAGLPGALFAMIGVLTPTFTICFAVACFYQRAKKSSLFQKILFGIRPACIGLTFGSIVSLSLTNYIVEDAVHPAAILMGLVGFSLYHAKKVNVPGLMLLSGLTALLIF